MITLLQARRLSAICALGLLGACALPASPSQQPSRYRSNVPLVARLQTNVAAANGLRFYLNRPAHVALFEVVPGRGIGLLYPTQGLGSRSFSDGTHLARTYNSSFRANYLPATQFAAELPPRYILLVASEQPLRLEEMQRSPYGMRSFIGFQQFTSFNPYSTMQALTESVLSPMAGDDWTTDVYVDWPTSAPRAATQLVRMQCPSGQSLLVPYDQMFMAVNACDDRQLAKFIPPPEEPGDTTGVRPPRRGRPVPEGSADASAASNSRQPVRDEATPRVPRRGRPVPEGSADVPAASNSRQPARDELSPRAPRPTRSGPERTHPRSSDAAPQPTAAPAPAPASAPAPPRAEPRPAPRVEPPAPRAEAPVIPNRR